MLILEVESLVIPLEDGCPDFMPLSEMTVFLADFVITNEIFAGYEAMRILQGTICMLAIHIETFEVVTQFIFATDKFAGIRFTIITFEIPPSKKTETLWTTNLATNLTLVKTRGNMFLTQFNLTFLTLPDRRNVLMDNLLWRTNANRLFLEIFDADWTIPEYSHQILEVGAGIPVVLFLSLTFILRKTIDTMFMGQVPDLIEFPMKLFKEPINELDGPTIDVQLIIWDRKIVQPFNAGSSDHFGVLKEEGFVDLDFLLDFLSIDDFGKTDCELSRHLLFEVRKEEQIL